MPAIAAEQAQQYLVTRHPDARLSDFQHVNSGWESDIYAFTLHFAGGMARRLILRLFSGQEVGAKAAREAAGMERLYQVGYPVPQVMLYESDPAPLGAPFIVMEAIAGQALWPLLSSLEGAAQAALLDRFCGVVAQLHRLDWQPFTPHAARYAADPAAILDDYLADVRQWYRTFAVEGFLAVADWLDAHRTAIHFRPAVVHQDFHANNVLLGDDDRLTVIDWTQLSVADYRADLAWTLTIMADLGIPGWRKALLAGYERAAGHPVENLDYFSVMAYCKLIASTIVSLRVGPESQGLRSESADSIAGQMPALRHLCRRIQSITGLVVPEIAEFLGEGAG